MDEAYLWKSRCADLERELREQRIKAADKLDYETWELNAANRILIDKNNRLYRQVLDLERQVEELEKAAEVCRCASATEA